MAPGKKSSSDDRAQPAGATTATDAIALLRADHARVEQLFKQFDKLDEESDDKTSLVQEICNELTVHAAIEEEIFYPAAREAIEDNDLMDEATVEHMSAKALIAELARMEPGDELFDAKVTVLGEYVRHHVKEEQDEMFPKVRKAKVDLKALGAQMMERRATLMVDVQARADEGEDEGERIEGRLRGA